MSMMTEQYRDVDCIYLVVLLAIIPIRKMV